MANEDFYSQARQILAHLLEETPKANRDEVLDAYADILARLHAAEAHKLLNEVIDDARTRLDARLSPDPVRQTVASIQSTVQNLWDSLWKG